MACVEALWMAVKWQEVVAESVRKYVEAEQAWAAEQERKWQAFLAGPPPWFGPQPDVVVEKEGSAS